MWGFALEGREGLGMWLGFGFLLFWLGYRVLGRWPFVLVGYVLWSCSLSCLGLLCDSFVGWKLC